MALYLSSCAGTLRALVLNELDLSAEMAKVCSSVMHAFSAVWLLVEHLKFRKDALHSQKGSETKRVAKRTMPRDDGQPS